VQQDRALADDPARRGPNVFGADFDFAWEDRGLRAAAVVRRAGGERLGGTLYELEPGSAGMPLHVHHANEELAVVLAGRPTLRTPGGERELATGEVVAFPTGRRGAHTIENRGDEPARFLMLSTKVQPEIIEYPESGDIRVATRGPFDAPRPGDDPADAVWLLFERSSAVERPPG